MLPESAAYLQMLDDLRGQVGDMIVNLPAEALNWRPVDGLDDHATNSLAVMTAHAAGAEHFWITEIIGRRPPTRDRTAEFVTEVDGPGPLLAKLKATGEETARVLAELTRADLEASRDAQGRTVPVRWGILHAIEHTALHLGHMQITYQLWSSGRAYDTPRWFQRLQ